VKTGEGVRVSECGWRGGEERGLRRPILPDWKRGVSWTREWQIVMGVRTSRPKPLLNFQKDPSLSSAGSLYSCGRCRKTGMSYLALAPTFPSPPQQQLHQHT